jgi:hypothetical protein
MVVYAVRLDQGSGPLHLYIMLCPPLPFFKKTLSHVHQIVFMIFVLDFVPKSHDPNQHKLIMGFTLCFVFHLTP